MNLTPQAIAREVSATGFPGETLEKVFRLMSLLDGLNAHPFLKRRVALKGGTALNLFVFDVPRLSVDIDLNYIGAADRDTMLAERPKVEQAVHAVCSRDGLAAKRMPSEHAGGKWQLAYTASTGDSGNLELDVNFMLRVPLWPPVVTECRPVGSFRAAPAHVLDPHELAAGRLAALLARSASRDIFDACRLLSAGHLDPTPLRVAFSVYGGINRKDWRTVSPADVVANPADMLREHRPDAACGSGAGPCGDPRVDREAGRRVPGSALHRAAAHAGRSGVHPSTQRHRPHLSGTPGWRRRRAGKHPEPPRPAVEGAQRQEALRTVQRWYAMSSSPSSASRLVIPATRSFLTRARATSATDGLSAMAKSVVPCSSGANPSSLSGCLGPDSRVCE